MATFDSTRVSVHHRFHVHPTNWCQSTRRRDPSQEMSANNEYVTCILSESESIGAFSKFIYFTNLIVIVKVRGKEELPKKYEMQFNAFTQFSRWFFFFAENSSIVDAPPVNFLYLSRTSFAKLLNFQPFYPSKAKTLDSRARNTCK